MPRRIRTPAPVVPAAVTAAFPTRPLPAPRRVAGSPAALLLVAAVLLAATLAVCWLGYRNIAPDLRIRSAPFVMTTGTLDGECSVGRKLPIADCDVDVSYEVDGVVHQVDRSFMWFDLGSDEDYYAVVVRSAEDPSLATVDLALDKLPNRVLTVLFFAVITAGLCALSVREAGQAAAVRRAYRRPGGVPLRPTVVTVTGARRAGLRGTAFQFAVHADGTVRGRSQILSKRQGQPLMVGPDLALAAHPAGAPGHPVLLDVGLTRLDLTSGERARLHAAVAGEAAPPRPTAPEQSTAPQG